MDAETSQSRRRRARNAADPAFDLVDTEVVPIYVESIFVVALAPFLLVARRGALPTHRLRAV